MKNLNESINPIYDLNQLEMLSRELFANKNELKYLRDLTENTEKLSINKVEYPKRGFDVGRNWKVELLR